MERGQISVLPLSPLPFLAHAMRSPPSPPFFVLKEQSALGVSPQAVKSQLAQCCFLPTASRRVHFEGAFAIQTFHAEGCLPIKAKLHVTTRCRRMKGRTLCLPHLARNGGLTSCSMVRALSVTTGQVRHFDSEVALAIYQNKYHRLLQLANWNAAMQVVSEIVADQLLGPRQFRHALCAAQWHRHSPRRQCINTTKNFGSSDSACTIVCSFGHWVELEVQCFVFIRCRDRYLVHTLIVLFVYLQRHDSD